MKKARMWLLPSAVCLAVLMAGQAPAAEGPGLSPEPFTGIPEEPGKTVAGVQVSKAVSDHLSFEVPLYVTMAAVEGPELLCPGNYSIRNTSKAPDGSAAAIAVTGLTVQKAPGSTWTLADVPVSGRQLSFSVGKVPLPELPDDNWKPVNIKVADSAFYSVDSGQYRPIPSTGLLLPLEGRLPAGWSPESKAGAAAQFRLRYSVSLLDKGGNPIGVVYQGPVKEEAQQSVSPNAGGGEP